MHHNVNSAAEQTPKYIVTSTDSLNQNNSETEVDNRIDMQRNKLTANSHNRVIKITHDLNDQGAKADPYEISTNCLLQQSRLPACHSHEVLYGSVNPYFDFDRVLVKGDKPPEREKEIKAITTAIASRYSIHPSQLLVFDSSGPYTKEKNGCQAFHKLSYRVIIPNYGYYYQSKDMLPIIKDLNHDLKYFDEAPYKQEGKRQTMRFPYSRKMGDSRVLQLVDHMQPTCPLVPIGDITPQQFASFVIQADRVSDGTKYIALSDNLNNSDLLAQKANFDEFDDFNADILEAIDKLIPDTDIHVKRQVRYNKMDILELTRYTAKCPICQREHHSNHNYVVFNKEHRFAYLKCHAQSAKGVTIELIANKDMSLLLKASDLSLATIFANHHKDDIKIIDKDHSYIWDPKTLLWLKKDNIYVINLIGPFLSPLLQPIIDMETDKKKLEKLLKIQHNVESTRQMNAIFSCLRTMLPGSPAWVDTLDCKPKLFPCNDGTVVELDTGTARPRTRDDLFTVQCPVHLMNETEYDPSAFLRFLTDVFLGDQTIISYMRRQLGLSLAAMTNREFYIWLGVRARNGKSSLSDIMSAILGPFFAAISKYIFVKASGDKVSPNGHSSHLMPLLKARMAIAQESDPGDELHSSQLKTLSANDTISLRGMYGAAFAFRNYASLVLPTNHPTLFQVDDQGLVDRFAPTYFNARFVENPDPNIPYERKADEKFVKSLQYDPTLLCQTFTYLVGGAKEYFTSGMQCPQSIQAKKQEAIKDQDFFRQFIDIRCEINRTELKKGTLSRDLLDAYNLFVSEYTNERLTSPKLNERLNSLNHISRHTNRGAVYPGIFLKKMEDEPAQQQIDLINQYI